MLKDTENSVLQTHIDRFKRTYVETTSDAEIKNSVLSTLIKTI